MNWILLSLLAPLIWAASNLIDSNLIEKHFKDPFAPTSIAGLLNIIPGIFIFIYTGFPIPELSYILLAIVVGATYTYVLIPYLFAMSKSSAASVVLMWNIYPIFTMAMAWFFLGESLTNQQYLAVILLVCSAMIAAYKKGKGKCLNSALIFVLIGTVMEASQAVLEKYLYLQLDFWDIFPWMYIGGFFAGISLFIIKPHNIKEFKRVLKTNLKKLIAANESLDTIATFVVGLAISLGPVSLVNGMQGFQAIFIMLFLMIPAVRIRVGEKQHLQKSQIFQFALASGLGLLGIALI